MKFATAKFGRSTKSVLYGLMIVVPLPLGVGCSDDRSQSATSPVFEPDEAMSMAKDGHDRSANLRRFAIDAHETGEPAIFYVSVTLKNTSEYGGASVKLLGLPGSWVDGPGAHAIAYNQTRTFYTHFALNIDVTVQVVPKKCSIAIFKNALAARVTPHNTWDYEWRNQHDQYDRISIEVTATWVIIGNREKHPRPHEEELQF